MEDLTLSLERENLEAEARMYYRQLSSMYCQSGNCGDEFPFGNENDFIRNYMQERLLKIQKKK
ncbi:MAG: hypothetical protein U9R34_04775 [Nanoarchaeota archaeon]|nr:hypothetical protein [Nanoarchaeota archaeon]